MRRVVALVLLAFACGRGEPPKPAEQPARAAPPPLPPAAAEAKEIIASSPEWSEFEFTHAAWTLPMKRSLMNDPARAAAADLARAGWIRIAGDEVVLTAKALGDKRWLVRPNGYVDIVPLAKKELIAVTAVRPAPDGTATAELSWRWLPNEIGSAFRSGVVHDRLASTHAARATLLHDGSGWTVLRIVTSASPPSS